MFTQVGFNIHFISAGIIILISTVIGYITLKKGKVAKELELPVIAYILIITVMLIYSFSMFFNTNLDFLVRISFFLGSTLFYISDAILAYIMFIQTSKNNIFQLINLTTYYSALFLMAFLQLSSTSMFI
jgi:uncharacterized membrane protein YhhN